MNNVIIACDFASAEATYAFLDKFNEVAEKPYLKIGMELYYAEGPAIVRELKARGFKIFLDLKLHDIPNTVKKAMAVLSRLDVDMCNLHAAGTIEMMKAAVEGLTRPDGTRPILLAVTQLTSTSEERMHNDLLIQGTMPEVVCHYAKNAKLAGLDGVVCSPLEAGFVKEACGKDFYTVTPGIRLAEIVVDTAQTTPPSGGAGGRLAFQGVGDQVRITTPARAREIGSDFIVVGRPITAAEDPVAAYTRCLTEFNN